MAKIDEVLNRHWRDLKDAHPGILNVAISEKWVNGINTHEPSITVYVAKKLPMTVLDNSEKLPSSIEDIPVDVIELAPKTWTAGKTDVSEKHPEEQKRLLGATREPKVSLTVASPKRLTGSLTVDWLDFCSPIQDQGNCGSCVGEGTIGVMEACYRVAENNPKDQIKLSEAQAFFCSGGTCSLGSNCQSILNYLKINGVCLEQYLPYKPVDQACNAGILPGWQSSVYRISEWSDITDLATIRQLIAKSPLIACMDVHQSFFNYISGIYKNLGPTDPVAGGHCIGNIGIDDTKSAWHGRNSWGVGWGEKGYFWITFGDSGFDSEAWHLIPILNPNPTPVPPVPVKKNCWLKKMLKW
jgi:C1A family cysteine protease